MADEPSDELIRELERDASLPYSLKQLVSVYRRLGKTAKRAGDYRRALSYFNRMLNLSVIWHEVYGAKTSGIAGQEVDEAEKFIRQFRRAHHTLYPFTYWEHGPVKGDVLLSATDYRNLRQLSDLVQQNPPVVEVVAQEVGGLQVQSPLGDKSVDLLREREIRAQRAPATRGKARYIGPNGQDITIEQCALIYYRSAGYEGLWSENEYWWQIMTLLYWDVVYARIPGIYEPRFGSFPSRMQDIPRDIFTKEFYGRRQRMINARHKALSEGGLFGLRSPSPERELRAAWRRHRGKACRFFDQWQKFTVEELALAMQGLAPAEVIAIMDRLLRDFNSHRRGLPDLFLVKDNRPLFVEVKSRRERISEPQLEWHRYLSGTVRIPVEVCRVVAE